MERKNQIPRGADTHVTVDDVVTEARRTGMTLITFIFGKPYIVTATEATRLMQRPCGALVLLNS